MSHKSECRCVVCLVDRSSLGTPEAKALRASVTDDEVARVMDKARELEADDE